jgi:hypothetical protein
MEFLAIPLLAFGLSGALSNQMIDKPVAIEHLYRSCLEIIDSPEDQVPQDIQTVLAEYATKIFSANEDEAGKISLLNLLALKKLMMLKIRLGDTTTELLPVPSLFPGLQQEDVGHIIHLQLKQQTDGWSCAYWCLGNTRALTMLSTERRCLTPTSIRDIINKRVQQVLEEVKENARRIGPIAGENLIKPDVYQLQKLIVQERLANTYILQGCGLAGVGNVPGIHCYHIPDYRGEFVDDIAQVIERSVHIDERGGAIDTFFADRLQELRLQPRNAPLAIHFICLFPYDPGDKDKFHWMLISVVKPAFRKPFMMVLDSCDFRIPHLGNELYISRICQTLVRPFYQKK